MAPRSRVWLITGCSSGFGLELAQVVVARGDRVLAASRNPDKVKELTNNDNLKLVRLDHNEPLPALKKAVNDLISVYGTIDVVVNNAAYVQTGTIEEATPEETLRQFQANFFGPLNLYRAVLPHLRSKGEGTLVTIGSMAAWYPMNSCNLYNASKAALRWATVGLADEIRGFGIKHCLVEPGFFRTSLLKPDANFAGTQASTRMQLGNPAKGAEIIYEAVTSTGVAEGMPFPEFLPLGSDALTEITKAAHKTLDAIEEWRRISALSDFPEGK